MKLTTTRAEQLTDREQQRPILRMRRSLGTVKIAGIHSVRFADTNHKPLEVHYEYEKPEYDEESLLVRDSTCVCAAF